jgi:hypothetical protein
MKTQILKSSYKEKAQDLDKIKGFRNDIKKCSTINYMQREKLGDIII